MADSSVPGQAVRRERRFDLDWIRIAAFGLLILYHIGMVFVPWSYHVKSTHLIAGLEPRPADAEPMAAQPALCRRRGRDAVQTDRVAAPAIRPQAGDRCRLDGRASALHRCAHLAHRFGQAD